MTDIFDRILMLKKSSIFSEVNTENLLIVAQELEEEIYIKGDHIFKIGDRGNRMYMVESGIVGISTCSSNPSGNFLARFECGECFGEMNLLDDLPRSATAYVIENSTVLSLEKDKLHRLIIRHPHLSLGIMKSLSIRLRNTTNLLTGT